MRAATLDVRTPEGVTFSHPLATPVTRFLAWLVDLACIVGLQSVTVTVLSSLQVISADLTQAVLAIAYFVLSIGYGIATEWLWHGQTLGKRVLHLRVLDAEGLKLTAGQIVIRNLLRFVDSMPVFYLVGGAAMLASRHGQRLGDFAAGTVVVRVAQPEVPDVELLMAGKYNSLVAYPHLAARLRQRVTPRQASVAVESLMRREELEPEARLALFGELADGFRQQVAFPAEAEEGLADEQYVRNVVDLLFRGAGGSRR